MYTSTGRMVIRTEQIMKGSPNSMATLIHDEVDLTSDPRWQLAERAAQSGMLVRAPQLRSILRYVVRQAIVQPGEPIREYEVACRVLGRRSDFNPVDDNIVRVQMGHLRRKLELYFSTEGRHEPIIIRLHRGSYAPDFDLRETTSTTAEAQRDPEPQSDVPHSVTPTVRWPLAFLFVAGLAVAFVAGRFIHTGEHLSDHTTATAVTNPILRRIFTPGTPVNVVVADIALAVMQNTAHSDISVAQYLDHKYPDNILANVPDVNVRVLLSDLSHHRYTSLDDADVVGNSFQWGTLLGVKPTVRYARDLHVRDFEHGNFIIVGSRRSNPWTLLFEHDLNFAFEEDPATRTFHFRNRNPKPGEATTYGYSPQPDGQSIGYVDIALLPNLTHTGTVLLLNGFSMETNEAAANLIFRNELPPAVSRAMATQANNAPVEILLRVHNLDGSDNGSDIIAIRTDPTLSR